MIDKQQICKFFKFVIDKRNIYNNSIVLYLMKHNVKFAEGCTFNVNPKWASALSKYDSTIIPDNFTINSNCTITYPFQTIGKNLTVNGNLDIKSSILTTIGENLTVNGNLLVKCDKLKIVGENLRVTDSCNIDNCIELKQFPLSSNIGVNLVFLSCRPDIEN